MRAAVLIATLATAFLTAGCIISLGPVAYSTGSGGHYRGTPPPQSPAHGYRHHHPADGMELVFDSELGAYVAVDLPLHYYRDGVYLRFDDGRWFASTHLDGPWNAYSASELPPGLRAKYGAKVRRGNGKRKAAVPARGAPWR